MIMFQISKIFIHCNHQFAMSLLFFWWSGLVENLIGLFQLLRVQSRQKVRIFHRPWIVQFFQILEKFGWVWVPVGLVILKFLWALKFREYHSPVISSFKKMKKNKAFLPIKSHLTQPRYFPRPRYFPQQPYLAIHQYPAHQ